ncbi:hypothetical protein THA_1255 [Thermosipho africanus TCF52B]|uniref:Uncharacterized protein n=1 Tax=Thermosipho africanus (strain TCF52B) TaxID=484019 RepID=B7IHY6_THEAB|nr:hypothetical protein THA_1255 [Thermosipho africanus TCF52B]
MLKTYAIALPESGLILFQSLIGMLKTMNINIDGFGIKSFNP